jgi:peptidoglycan/LPS O-acetylase OafA/YrhL
MANELRNPETPTIAHKIPYRPEIDGLRAIAVTPVILFHAGFQTFSGGFVGVDVFFVISGYLITSIILKDLENGTFSFLDFYERRARRILPALFLVMCTCIPIAWFCMLPGQMKEFCRSLASVSLFASNIHFWRGTGYFDTAAEQKPLLHTWSLAVEEQYYMLFPIILSFLWRQGKPQTLVCLGTAFIGSLALAEWASLAKPAAAFFLLPTRGWELLTGSLTAFYLAERNQSNINNNFNEIYGIFGVALIGYSVLFYNSSTPFPGLYALAPTIGAALVILFVTKQTTLGRLIGSKPLVLTGTLSYSAYLWHQPILVFVRILVGKETTDEWGAPALLAVFIIAFFSWKFVEQPFRIRNILPKKVVYFSGLFSLFFLIFGLIGDRTSGFLFRYSEGDQYLASLRQQEMGDYVQRRFQDLAMKDFDTNDPRRKILIIGDSFAQDLVNALYENDFQMNNQVSTRYIAHRCGNLFISRSKFQDKIASECNREAKGFGYEGLYEDERLRRLMLDSDEIWFASAWDRWTADLISESISNADFFASKPLKVFGRKSLGNIDVKSLLKEDVSRRILLRGLVANESTRTNDIIRMALPEAVFVDVQRLLCGENTGLCLLFDNQGNLKSYDGSHLTVYGAKLLGKKLALGPLFGYF